MGVIPLRPRPEHDYRRCQDDDCPRFICQVYKEGYQDGHAAGSASGYAAGYEAGYASGREAGYRQGYAEGCRETQLRAAPKTEAASVASAGSKRRRGLLGLPCERCGTFLFSDEVQCPHCKTKVMGVTPSR